VIITIIAIIITERNYYYHCYFYCY